MTKKPQGQDAREVINRFRVKNQLSPAEQRRILKLFHEVGVMPFLFVIRDECEKLASRHGEESFEELADVLGEVIEDLEGRGY